MALDLIAELEALIARLDTGSVGYAICGGIAVAIHGHPRATMDIDLLVPDDQVDSALQAARDVGFDIPARPDHRQWRLEEIWQDRIVVPWRQRLFSVVSRDGLIAMKRLAARPQDVADIAALERRDDEDDDDEEGEP